MARLSAEEIARHAYAAGFRGQKLTIAIAVALAESGGNPKAHNAVPPDNSYGLWQINMLGALGPDRRRALHLSSNSRLFDPAVNARAAWLVSEHGRTFRPWSVYLYGQYRRHLAVAAKAARSVKADPGGGRTPRPGGQGTKGRVVLDLPELHRLGRLFQHSADRVEHVRRTVRDVAADVEPARTRLKDAAVGSLLQAVFATLDAPTQLARAAERLDRQGQYADRVRKLAQDADGADGRWSTAEKMRFVRSVGSTIDPFERAILEALLGGRIVTAKAAQAAQSPARPPAPGVAGLSNGRVPASRLVSVGEGEKLTRAAGTMFRRMDAAARADGVQLRVNSGYRTYAEQAALYEAYRNGTGNLAAPPGRSTHGLGLSADINVPDARTLAWLRRHAGEYGFVNDVPSEPWHWTYRPSR